MTKLGLESLSIDQLRALVRRTGQGDPDAEFVWPPKTPRPEPLPLSPGQSRIWFLEQLGLTESVYQVRSVIRMDGDLDLPSFRWALERVVERHESLRTRIESRDGEPAQIIDPPSPPALEIVDLSSEKEVETACEAVLQDRANRPFELERGPLFRVLIIVLGGGRQICQFNVHHIIFDGISMGVLMQELSAFYNERRAGVVATVQASPPQYADHAVWQLRALAGDRLERLTNYWVGRLADAPPALILPTDRPRPQRARYHGAVHQVPLSPSSQAAIMEFARSQGATLFMVLLAAFQIVLSRWSGQDDLVVGVPVATRPDRSTESMIGFLINTLALRGKVDAAVSFRRHLRSVRSMALGDYAYQELPFDRLVSALRPKRDLSRTPVFQVMLAVQNAVQGHLELSGLRCERLDLEEGPCHFEMVLSAEAAPDGFSMSIEYARELFDPPTIGRFASDLLAVLKGGVTDPDRSLGVSAWAD